MSIERATSPVFTVCRTGYRTDGIGVLPESGRCTTINKDTRTVCLPLWLRDRRQRWSVRVLPRDRPVGTHHQPLDRSSPRWAPAGRGSDDSDVSVSYPGVLNL